MSLVYWELPETESPDFPYQALPDELPPHTPRRHSLLPSPPSPLLCLSDARCAVHIPGVPLLRALARAGPPAWSASTPDVPMASPLTCCSLCSNDFLLVIFRVKFSLDALSISPNLNNTSLITFYSFYPALLVHPAQVSITFFIILCMNVFRC